MWQLIQNCLPNSVFLNKRKILDSNTCPLCKLGPETNTHIFLECPYFSIIRDKMPILNSNEYLNFAALLFYTLHDEDMSQNVAITLWLMWGARNDFIFKQTPIDCTRILFNKELHKIPNPKRIRPKQMITIKWEPPPKGWFKLNINGSACSNPGNAWTGGIIRDHNGDFITAFSINIGIATNNKAEIWAFQQGVKIAVDLEITHLIIQTDSTFLISCLRRQEACHSTLKRLLEDARRSLQRLEQATVASDIGKLMWWQIFWLNMELLHRVIKSYVMMILGILLINLSKWIFICIIVEFRMFVRTTLF